MVKVKVGDRIADWVAKFVGSWLFIGLFFLVMSVWIIINLVMTHPYDPYPFILFNLVLSTIAAIQAPLIMMSANRKAEKDSSRIQKLNRDVTKILTRVSDMEHSIAKILALLEVDK